MPTTQHNNRNSKIYGYITTLLKDIIFHIQIISPQRRSEMPPGCQAIRPAPPSRTLPTSLTRWESSFPLGRRWYRAILEAHVSGCSSNMLDIAVLCSARRSILAGPLDIRARNCAIASYGYAVVDSDHVLLMHLLRMYTLVRDSFLREGKLEELGAWCRRCGLDRAASEVAAQEVTRLTSWLVKHPGMALQYTPQNSSKPILLALVKVFYTHLAIGCPQAYYGRDSRWETVPNREIARITPASAVYRLAPQWVLYNSIKHCLGWSEMHIVSTVYPEWLLVCGFCRVDRRGCRADCVPETFRICRSFAASMSWEQHLPCQEEVLHSAMFGILWPRRRIDSGSRRRDSD